MQARALAFGLLAAVVLHGCKFNREEHASACNEGENDCSSGEQCVRGFCVPVARDSGMGRADAAADDAGARDGGALTGQPCAAGQPPEPCYDGPAGTEDVGVCRGGERACVGGVYTQCLGQVVMSDEDCDELDNDCDGTTDEIAMSAPCDTRMRGICNAGMLVCRGAFAVCEPQNLAIDEVCNGSDDDCDGNSDEVVAIECFPPGAGGCTTDAEGAMECTGLCHTGETACDEGQGQCVGAVTAVDEACTSGGGTASDEDCDLSIDEMCPCTTGQVRPCYGGSVGTADNEPCRPGTQACVAGFWGDCQGQVLPGVESCQNPDSDDDCDGTPDDLLQDLGESCTVASNSGICRDGTWQCTAGAEQPVCVTAEPQPESCDGVDQDCDGYFDEDLTGTDENCSECGDACTSGSHCCHGACRSEEELRHDPENCGGCGVACGEGTYCCWNDCIPTGGGKLPGEEICGCEADCRDGSCCGKDCVDLQNDLYNCGFCGNDCTVGGFRQRCCEGECSPFCVTTQ